jgi:hypothetical protein
MMTLSIDRYNFLEIVKFTKGTPICLNYFTNDNSKVQIELEKNI